MPNIDAILREINKELLPQFEEKLRAHLAEQDKEWLIEQIVRLTLDAHSLEEMDRQHFRDEQTRRRQERIERVKKLQLGPEGLRDFVGHYKEYDRDRLIRENLLSADAPPRGKELITAEFRTGQGNELLQRTKDLLFGFLFGDESTDTHLQRAQRRLLTLTLPSTKAEVLNFVEAATEFRAQGTWHDPEGATRDRRTDNTVLEIEYGDVEGGQIGEGVVTALRLINHLEINEEVLYGRMEDIERSTLVS